MPGSDPLTERRRAILDALADQRALTGPQLTAALQARPQLVNRDLAWLAAHGFVLGATLAPTGLGRPPRLWRLRQAGAEAVGARDFGSHFYRWPADDILSYRSLQSALAREVEMLPGWQLITPGRGFVHQDPAWESPQSLLLRASLAHEGDPPDLLSCVPRRCNDYVAFCPGAPTHTTLLILHPPRAGRAYWTRPRPPINSRARRPTPAGRLALYWALISQMPDRVAAVFPDERAAEPYIEILEAAGLLVLVMQPPGEVARFLAAIGA
jgi:hypothetical protein